MDRRNKILVVDDMELNRAILGELFQSEYKILEAENGQDALELIQKHQDSIAVILLDIVMPVMDGFQLMSILQKNGTLRKIPVILITADTYKGNEIKGLELGAFDIILKPFDTHIVKRRVENSVELYRHKNHLENMVTVQTKKLTETNDFIVDALSTVIEYRNLESGQHNRRIRIFTKTLLESVSATFPEYHLEQKDIDTIASASAMHDIGKIAIPDSVLLKPGRLTNEEFEIMKTHTTKGCEILRAFKRMDNKAYLRYSYNICRHHHERWDGRGYPDGLRGDQIPLCAQVVSVADVYDALTNHRCYKPALPHEEAVRMILEGECGNFSPKLIECFKKVCGRFKEYAHDYADGKEPLDEKPFSPPTLEEVLKSEEDRLSLALNDASVGLKKETLERDALINAIPGGVAKVVLDDEYRILLASDGFFRLTGYSRDEYMSPPIEGKGIRLILPEDIPAVNAAVSRQVDLGQGIYTEYRIRKKDGSIAFISVHGNQVARENGMDIVQAVFIDNTAVRQTEKKLFGLMNSVPGGIARIKIGDSIKLDFASGGFYELCGYTQEEYGRLFSGSHDMDIVFEDDRASLSGQIRSYIEQGDARVTLEYRIVRQDGSLAWLLVNGIRTDDEDGCPCYQCVFTDITKSKAVQERLLLSETRYRIILERAQDVIFEWDMKTDSVYHSPTFTKKFGYSLPPGPLPDDIAISGIIHAEDIPRLKDGIGRLRNGEGFVEDEFRVKTAAGTYLWCKVKATLIFGAEGEPVRTIGILTDIDDFKREKALLELEEQKDPLTGIYNRATARTFIESYLEKEGNNGNHALFIVDIDNFRDINDRFGHLCGDAILCEIAARIHSQFRDEDIAGRVGGDEFIVFLKSIPDTTLADQKAGSLRKILCQQVHHAQECFDVTGSIGAALYPQDGATFEKLFKHAALALCDSKRKGKNCYTFYCERKQPTV